MANYISTAVLAHRVRESVVWRATAGVISINLRIRFLIGRRAISGELKGVTLTVIFTGLMWVPYILDRIMVRGLMGAMANPSRHDEPQSEWDKWVFIVHYRDD